MLWEDVTVGALALQQARAMARLTIVGMSLYPMHG